MIEGWLKKGGVSPFSIHMERYQYGYRIRYDGTGRKRAFHYPSYEYRIILKQILWHD